jgi:hypothetical protein
MLTLGAGCDEYSCTELAERSCREELPTQSGPMRQSLQRGAACCPVQLNMWHIKRALVLPPPSLT